MLPKIAHYGGFQSYGDLPYPTLKTGKKTNDSNEVWQQMAIREKDDLKLYDNTQRWMTVYKKQVERVVSPEDYQNPTKIPKGLMGFGNENADKLDATGSIKKKHELAVPDFALSGTKFTQPFDHTSKGVELFNKTIQNLKNGRRKENYQINDFLNEFLTAVEPEGLQQEVETLLQSSMRVKDELKKEFVSTGVEHWKSTYAAAVDYPFTTQKATRPQWSLNKTPYSIEKYPRSSEYHNQYGNKATNPVDRLDKTQTMPPVPKSQDELKKGTTQTSFHLPGYTGHIPHEPKTDEDLVNGIGAKERTTWMKQNITEYYHTRIPGYAGHRPRCALNDRGTLREHCFSTAGEKY